MVKRSQRLVALFAAVIILFEVAAVPQKAKAVAITASVVASVAAIMTACGVTYWAASQTDAVEYLGAKIDEYLGTLETVPQSYEDWLGINASSELFDVPTAGVMRFTSGIANKVLDFVRWFTEDEGVVSGGSVVTDADSGVTYVFNVNSSGSFSLAQDSSFSAFSMHFDSYARSVSPADSYAVLQMPADFVGSSVRIVHSSHSLNGSLDIGFGTSDGNTSGDAPRIGTWSSAGGFNETVSILSGQYLWIGIRPASRNTPISGDLSFTISNIVSSIGTAGSYAISPSDTVAVPQDLTEDETFDVIPSVPLTEGMSVEQASDAVLDGVASDDGLTAEAEAAGPPSIDLSGILEMLTSILNAILSIPSHISSGVQSIVSGIGQKVDAFKDSVQGFLTTIDSYLYDISQRVTEMAHDITMSISDRLEYLFVPDEVYVQNYVQSIMHLFDGRVGILTFPLSVFVDFLTRFSSIADGDHSFHWGNIHEPFSGKQVIAAGSYDLDDAVASSPMSTVYSIYLVVVKAIIAFWFLRLCQRKYELIVNGH